MPRRQSARIALGGMSAALCVALMFFSGILPFATYALPALAGIALIPTAVEMGCGTAALSYAAVALLSLFLVPDKETAAMFAAFFGYYPILRFRLERVRHKALRWLAKLGVFNLSMILAYQVFMRLIGLGHILEEFGEGLFAAVVLAIGNVGFIVYDYALANMTRLYIWRLRERFFRR